MSLLVHHPLRFEYVIKACGKVKNKIKNKKAMLRWHCFFVLCARSKM